MPEETRELYQPPCANLPYCPVKAIARQIEDMKQMHQDDAEEHKSELKEIRGSLSRICDTLSDLKVINEALGSVRAEINRHGNTLGRVWDRLDDLQKTKADNSIGTEIRILANSKADKEDVEDSIKELEKEMSLRPTRSEIIRLAATIVTIVSVVVGLIFTGINLAISHKKIHEASHVAAQTD